MKEIIDYQSALDYIYSFVDNSRTHQQNLSPENFDLSRVRNLCELIGDPQEKYWTVHVAGSKGKGSVCAMMASVLKEAGYRVGLYTSPHLEEFSERIQINGIPVDESMITETIQYLREFIDQVEGITTFEVITVLGFTVFARMGVDAAVIEVGLGGRLDATNVIHPMVSVITSLSLEHTYVLGDTIEAIAGEKGGIIKEGVPVISSPQPVSARQVLADIAKEKHSDIRFVDDVLTVNDIDYSNWTQSFRLEGNIGERIISNKLRISLLGEHQLINAMTALAALKILEIQGINLDHKVIQEGFAKVEWPARFEVLDPTIPFIIDAAHNEESMRRLSETLVQIFPSRQVILIYGVSADKNVSGMIDAFADLLSSVICTASQHPRAMDPRELAGYFRNKNVDIYVERDIGAAIQKGQSLLTGDQILVGAGSLFVVGEIRTIWKEKIED